MENSCWTVIELHMYQQKNFKRWVSDFLSEVLTPNFSHIYFSYHLQPCNRGTMALQASLLARAHSTFSTRSPWPQRSKGIQGAATKGMGIDGSKYDWFDHMFQYVPIKTWWGVVGVPVSFEEPDSVSGRKWYWKLAKIDGPNDLPKSVPQNHESLLVESLWPHWNRSISRDWS